MTAIEVVDKTQMTTRPAMQSGDTVRVHVKVRERDNEEDAVRPVKTRAMRTLENAMRRWGFHRVAGCDEVGRGCLAGPVVAAAVILDPDRYISGICDSKTTTLAQRERLYTIITRK